MCEYVQQRVEEPCVKTQQEVMRVSKISRKPQQVGGSDWFPDPQEWERPPQPEQSGNSYLHICTPVYRQRKKEKSTTVSA